VECAIRACHRGIVGVFHGQRDRLTTAGEPELDNRAADWRTADGIDYDAVDLRAGRRLCLPGQERGQKDEGPDCSRVSQCISDRSWVMSG
jgi:hypothetical protein